MTTPEQQAADPKRGRPDWPNQQVVRPDGSGPGLPPEGGTGGSTHPAVEMQPLPATSGELDALTKAELLEYAQTIGVTPANNNMSKEELREGVDAKLAEGAPAG